MSDNLQHECGVGLICLRKNLKYYENKYGSPYYGYQKLTLLLEKQHNRGQDGAGIACLSRGAQPGIPFFQLEKSCCELSLADLLERINRRISAALPLQEAFRDELAMSEKFPFCGEVYLGHLRYGTFGNRSLNACHPLIRDHSWRNHALLLAGNFNLTNTKALFQKLISSGHHPKSLQDSEILLALVVHYLERQPLTEAGSSDLDLGGILQRVASECDGGFHLCGVLGNGEAFALRDAAGIRPAFYYFDEEVVVAASERATIQTTFNLKTAEVHELPPGHALTVSSKGIVALQPCLPERPARKCVFERIYFSRGNDADIHRERRALGQALVPAILNRIEHDYRNTVFSYIPNTAQTCFFGLLDELYRQGHGKHVRFAQIAVKDAKFRTFISDADHRRDLFPHVYDVTYGIIRPGSDNLVVLDDSIVRGNTMRNAILPILDRLDPKLIVVASSAPPVRYPDCYGIDMASFQELIAFEALQSLLKKTGQQSALDKAVRLAEKDLSRGDENCKNRVKPLYALFSDEELALEISCLLRPPDLRARLAVVYQSCRQLRKCCPGHTGDWYFTGDYPTPGGNRVVNQALLNYAHSIDQRPY
ncbi:MAG: amidophosphoribosyltransferase [Oligosphaeraceae bacterium]|nr:amidophosphoribosyltransferase [Oligosphaeraceae bacterium]